MIRWLADKLDGYIHGPEYRAMVLIMEEQNQHDELRKECGCGEDDGKCHKKKPNKS
jgi:hypothetical protein